MPLMIHVRKYAIEQSKIVCGDSQTHYLLGFDNERLEPLPIKTYIRRLWLAFESSKNGKTPARFFDPRTDLFSRELDKLASEIASDPHRLGAELEVEPEYGVDGALSSSRFLVEVANTLLVTSGWGETLWGRKKASEEEHMRTIAHVKTGKGSKTILADTGAAEQSRKRKRGEDRHLEVLANSKPEEGYSEHPVWPRDERKIALATRHWMAALISHKIQTLREKNVPRVECPKDPFKERYRLSTRFNLSEREQSPDPVVEPSEGYIREARPIFGIKEEAQTPPSIQDLPTEKTSISPAPSLQEPRDHSPYPPTARPAAMSLDIQPTLSDDQNIRHSCVDPTPTIAHSINATSRKKTRNGRSSSKARVGSTSNSRHHRPSSTRGLHLFDKDELPGENAQSPPSAPDPDCLASPATASFFQSSNAPSITSEDFASEPIRIDPGPPRRTHPYTARKTRRKQGCGWKDGAKFRSDAPTPPHGISGRSIGSIPGQGEARAVSAMLGSDYANKSSTRNGGCNAAEADPGEFGSGCVRRHGALDVEAPGRNARPKSRKTQYDQCKDITPPSCLYPSALLRTSEARSPQAAQNLAPPESSSEPDLDLVGQAELVIADQTMISTMSRDPRHPSHEMHNSTPKHDSLADVATIHPSQPHSVPTTRSRGPTAAIVMKPAFDSVSNTKITTTTEPIDLCRVSTISGASSDTALQQSLTLSASDMESGRGGSESDLGSTPLVCTDSSLCDSIELDKESGYQVIVKQLPPLGDRHSSTIISQGTFVGKVSCKLDISGLTNAFDQPDAPATSETETSPSLIHIHAQGRIQETALPLSTSYTLPSFPQRWNAHAGSTLEDTSRISPQSILYPDSLNRGHDWYRPVRYDPVEFNIMYANHRDIAGPRTQRGSYDHVPFLEAGPSSVAGVDTSQTGLSYHAPSAVASPARASPELVNTLHTIKVGSSSERPGAETMEWNINAASEISGEAPHSDQSARPADIDFQTIAEACNSIDQKSPKKRWEERSFTSRKPHRQPNPTCDIPVIGEGNQRRIDSSVLFPTTRSDPISTSDSVLLSASQYSLHVHTSTGHQTQPTFAHLDRVKTAVCAGLPAKAIALSESIRGVYKVTSEDAGAEYTMPYLLPFASSYRVEKVNRASPFAGSIALDKASVGAHNDVPLKSTSHIGPASSSKCDSEDSADIYQVAGLNALFSVMPSAYTPHIPDCARCAHSLDELEDRFSKPDVHGVKQFRKTCVYCRGIGGRSRPLPCLCYECAPEWAALLEGDEEYIVHEPDTESVNSPGGS